MRSPSASLTRLEQGNASLRDLADLKGDFFMRKAPPQKDPIVEVARETMAVHATLSAQSMVPLAAFARASTLRGEALEEWFDSEDPEPDPFTDAVVYEEALDVGRYYLDNDLKHFVEELDVPNTPLASAVPQAEEIATLVAAMAILEQVISDLG